MKAITKAEVDEAVGNRVFPDFVIQAFNECIIEARVKNSERVMQDDVMDRTLLLGPTDLTRHTVFTNHWLDVEPFFTRAGWKVVYYKPAYNDIDSKAFYTFS